MPDVVLQPVPEVLDSLGRTAGGLTSAQALTQLGISGANTLAVRHRSTLWSSVARQLTHPLALLLWAAAIVVSIVVAVRHGRLQPERRPQHPEGSHDLERQPLCPLQSVSGSTGSATGGASSFEA